jgi:hypothetical protein
MLSMIKYSIRRKCCKLPRVGRPIYPLQGDRAQTHGEYKLEMLGYAVVYVNWYEVEYFLIGDQ